MQHSSVVMGLVHMNPETRLELEAHQTPMPCATCRSSPIPSGMHGVALLLQWLVLGNWVSPYFCGLGATVGWVGHQNVSDSVTLESAAFCSHRRLRSHLEPLQCDRMRAGWSSSDLYCFRACVDSSPTPQWGSMPLLVRALAPCSMPLLYWALSP